MDTQLSSPLPLKQMFSSRLSINLLRVINVALLELLTSHKCRASVAKRPEISLLCCSLEKITYSSSGKYECVFDPVGKQTIEVKCKLSITGCFLASFLLQHPFLKVWLFSAGIFPLRSISYPFPWQSHILST